MFKDYGKAIQSKDLVNSHWSSYCSETARETQYLMALLGISRLTFRVLRRLKLLFLIKKRAQKKLKCLTLLQNYIACESHREAVLNILERFRKSM